MLTISDLLDDKRLCSIAKTESNLNEEDIALLYKMGVTAIFSNENITIPESILLHYTETNSFQINNGNDGKFFLRKDVSDMSEDIINMFIKSYTKKWIDQYVEQHGGCATYYLPETACSYMVEDLEKLQELGVKLTEANIETLMKLKDGISHFEEGKVALEKILSNM